MANRAATAVPAEPEPMTSNDDGRPREARALPGRPSLPSGRAVLGGVLVAVAALTTFVVAGGGDEGPSTSYVVARSALDVGDRVETDDLGLEPIELPDTVAEVAYRDPGDLEGAIVLAPVETGELVQSSSVSGPEAQSDSQLDIVELGFRLPRERALDGILVRGDFVDLLATFDSGNDAFTEVVIRDARVLRVGTDDSESIGSSDALTLTLALTSDQDALRAIHALDTATVTLVRATQGAGLSAGPDRYAGPSSEGGPR